MGIASDQPLPGSGPDPSSGPPHRALRLSLGSVLLLGLAVRGIFLVEVGSGPVWRLHEWSQSDMNYYHAWAIRIAHGDWTCRDIRPPFHDWMQVVADDYFHLLPGRLPEFEAEGRAASPPMTAAEAWWLRMLGGPGRFYQEPAYAYLAGITYAVCGPDPRFVFAWQALLGLVSAWLTWRIALRHFGLAAATLAGLLAALAAPVVLHEGLLLRDSLIAFFALAIVDRADAAHDSGRTRAWFVLGLTVGAGLLVKTLFLPFLLGAFVVAAGSPPRSVRVSGGRIAGLAGGVALALLPLVARNVHVGQPPFALAGNGGFAFVANNTADFPPSAAGYLNASTVAQVLTETNGAFGPSVAATLRTHPDRTTWLRLLAQKWSALWRFLELADNAGLHDLAWWIPVLKGLPTWWVIAPWAAAGLLLAARDPRRHAVLLGMAVATAAPLLVFNPLARWRLPLLLVLAPGAAAALVATGNLLRKRAWLRAGAVLAAVALFMAWSGRLPEGLSTPHRVAGHQNLFEIDSAPRIAEAVRAADWDAAADRLEEFLRHEPPFPAPALWRRSEPGGRHDRVGPLVDYFAGRHLAAAEACELAGRTDAAAAHRRHAERLRALVPQAAPDPSRSP